MRGPKTALVAAILSMALLESAVGCGYHRVQVVSPVRNGGTPLSFLEDGLTTKSDVLSRFNERRAVKFEDGRILVFPLDGKYRIASSDQKVRFHLTLVFDRENKRILEKHSLVRIR